MEFIETQGMGWEKRKGSPLVIGLTVEISRENVYEKVG